MTAQAKGMTAKGMFSAIVFAGALLAAELALPCARAHARTAAIPAQHAMSATTSDKGLMAPRGAYGSINKRKAETIALKDAGYKRKRVKRLSSKPGMRNGQSAFVVKFNFRKMHYTYAVSKWGGNVISRSAHPVNTL